ncbi:MAG: phosphoribosylamine--glycine ligase, partial [Clostridia bacterium]|nr:phosphoribosylamine--glycine ligase [Clostridia bacterium]
FKAAGSKIIVEEFLVGREVSVLCFTDGKTIVPMVSSQDHKRAYDNDEGLNTGGMGTFSPSKIYTNDIAENVYKDIIVPTMEAMNSENRKFKGVLYFGLMLTDKGVKVLEYNARFGDPETQVVLPRLKTDLFEIFDAIIDERLADINIEWREESAVCVILASGGYPENYEKGLPISIGDLDKDIILFHAGTTFKDGKLVTNGGRVIGVTALGKDIEEARAKAYANVPKVKFDKVHYRKDIGIKL